MRARAEQIQSDWRSGAWPESQTAAAQIAVAEGWQVLGIGKTRLVVRLSEERVLKLGWREQGVADNLVEWRVWETAGEDLRQWLCPCEGRSESGVLEQQLCLPVAWDPLGADRHWWELVRGLASHGISDTAVNLGVIQDRVVCYDYCSVSVALLMKLLDDEERDEWAGLIHA